MGTSLTGLTPATTYDALIKVGDNGPLSATAKVLSDGLGNDSILALSTSRVGIGTASPDLTLHLYNSAAALAYFESTSGNGAYVIWRNSGTSIGDVGSQLGISGSGSASNFMIASRSGDMILGSSSAERMRITSAGNVGIGTSTPESKLHVADGVSGGIVSIFVDNNINALNSTAQIKFTVDAGGSLTVGGAAIQAVNTDPNYANTDLVFRNSHISSGSLVEVFRLTDGARYLRMAGGTGGIQFNGDTAAANALDDYEEGTWTATLTDGTRTKSATAIYTKIGRVVYIQGGISNVEDPNSFTGDVYITGVPFTPLSGVSLYGFNNYLSTASIFTPYLESNQVIRLYRAGAASADNAQMQGSDLDFYSDIYFAGQFTV